MNEEQHKNIISALAEFVVRVSKGETTTEKEVEILPAVISALAELDRNV